MLHRSWLDYFIIALVSTLLVTRGLLVLSSVLANMGSLLLNHAESDSVEEVKAETLTEDAISILNLAARYESPVHARRLLGLAHINQGNDAQALALLVSSGEAGMDFVRRGRIAQARGDYEAASAWYQRALTVEPDLGDAWFHVGSLYEETEKRSLALESYLLGIQSGRFVELGESDFYLRSAILHGRQLEPPDWPAALEDLDRAIEKDDFRVDQSRIQAHFVRGEALRSLGRQREAMSEYEWVLANSPDHYWALSQLGFLVWRVDKDSSRAEKLLRAALNVTKQYKTAYRGLAIMYMETGRFLEAQEQYEQILALDPDDAEARDALNELTGQGN